MARKIVWQNKAVYQLEAIQKYLIEEWSENVAIRTTKRIFNVLALLKKYPEMGSTEYPEKQIRGFILTKHTRLLYQFDSNTIYILALFDNRQNPTLKFKKN